MSDYISHFQLETACVLTEYCKYFAIQNIFPAKTNLNNAI